MRQAQFVTTDQRRISIWPERLDIVDSDPVRIDERGTADFWYVQGTFDEADAEINAALNWGPEISAQKELAKAVAFCESCSKKLARMKEE